MMQRDLLIRDPGVVLVGGFSRMIDSEGLDRVGEPYIGKPVELSAFRIAD
jgi:hypothetical protein